ncbi:hypothetical protein [Winogradskyella alexanderae]|uniref:Lipoprotein n=1 Tax=Winogradskyella alexanderae TaxID=2877123 RepID=A0ABS7XV49_9FLAO|nr:hypothetical protein [Winogradskyella alexanderae]MCA0133909.1 hypothetical protein [Winogradskyella alexanderae]
MKKYLRALIISVLLLNLSCASKFTTTELQNHFSKDQINDLQKITEFFKSQICANKSSDFETCFTEMLPALLEYGWQSILDNVDFDKQKELYNSISKSTFEEIWEFGKETYPDTGLELRSLGSKYKGKYQNFLAELGKNNKELKEYADRVIGTGDFESSLILQSRIYEYPTDFDLSNVNIQLLIAIHYLTQNDQQKRTEKWESE